VQTEMRLPVRAPLDNNLPGELGIVTERKRVAR